jgi:hypothetical protein
LIGCLAACGIIFVPDTATCQLTESPGITSLMSKWKTYNLEHQEITGYRIQILATVDRRQMESLQRRFENLYPDYPLHVHHNEPYYHLKVGAFQTMQKAQAFMKKLQSDYPSALPVTDQLKVEELLLYDQ